MDVEQLRMILEVVSSAGGGAKTIGLAYFGLEFMKCFLGYGVLVFSIIFLSNVGFKISRLVANGFLRELREIVAPGDAYGRISSYEKNRIRTAVIDGVNLSEHACPFKAKT